MVIISIIIIIIITIITIITIIIIIIIFVSIYVMFGFYTRIFYEVVLGFATDCPCSVCCRGLTACLLYVGPFLAI